MKHLLLILILLSQTIYSQLEKDPSINTSKKQLFFPGPPRKKVIQAYLKNGNCMLDSTSISTDFYNGNEYIKINNKKILPAETDSLKIDSLAGVPCHGSWIWKRIHGKINVFTYHPFVNAGSYKYLQKSDSIRIYSPALLESYVSDNPAALTLVKNYRRNSGIAVSLFLGGFIIAASEILIESNYKAIPVVAGIACISIGAVFYFNTKDNCKKAIIIYNKS
jgi:hypothetical protein